MNPLTGIYGAASALRNTLFDHGVLTSHRLDRPVVSVGNLSVGGAGKTPFVIALGELLKARGIRFDVLSRGYGRQTRGMLVVDPDGSASDFGDEPLLIARRLGVPVIVGESRYQAGRVAEKKFDPQLHILDDGFQHRSLARDFDIVLLADRDFDDRLLPSGRLREPLASLSRADAIVLPARATTENAATENSAMENAVTSNTALRGKLLWRMKREIAVPAAAESPVDGVEADLRRAMDGVEAGLRPAPDGALRLRSGQAPPRPHTGLVVFCGIARPEQFFAQVRAAGITPAAEVAFRDHYPYRHQDIEHLLATQAKCSAGGFITTEKDAINLGPLQAELNPLSIASLRVALDDSDAVVDAILARIRAEGVQS